MQNIEDDILRGDISASAAGQKLERQYDYSLSKQLKLLEDVVKKKGIVLPAQSPLLNAKTQPSSELDSYRTDDEKYYYKGIVIRHESEPRHAKADDPDSRVYFSDDKAV